MSTKTTKAEPAATPGLGDKVQAFRDKAREILRACIISDLLQNIFDYNRADAENIKMADTAAKDVVRAEYRLSQLDDEDPDFETKKAKVEKELEDAKNILARTQKNTGAETARLAKLIETTEAKIKDVEDGKVKVSIDEVKALTDKMIENSL